MKKGYLKTLIALAALAALWGIFVYVNHRQSTQAVKSKTASQEKIFPAQKKDIQSFTLTPRQGEGLTCARENDQWEIVQPRKLPVDSTNLDGFLNSLTGATVDEVVDAHPANLKDFGLDPPAEILEVTTDAKPEKFTLLLGDDTPTGGGIYAQVAGNPRVITLASYLKSSLEKNMFDLRDKRAVTLNVNQLQKIEVTSKGKSYRLVKNPEGAWDLLLPPAVRADKFTVEGLVDELRGLSMQSILVENKGQVARYGFGNPAMTVRLAGGGKSETLVLGKKDGGRYDAMNTALDPVFTLNAGFLTQFQKDPSDLRDKNLFSFSTFNVKKLDVSTPKGHWVFEKEKNKWKETAPAGKEEPNDKVQALVDALSDLQAQSFPREHPTDLAAYGLTKPAYQFQVEFGEKNQTETVEVSKTGNHLYARRSTDPLPSELSPTALDGVEKALASL